MLSRLSVRFFFIRPDVRASMTSCHLLSTVQVVHRTSACEAVPILKRRSSPIVLTLTPARQSPESQLLELVISLSHAMPIPTTCGSSSTARFRVRAVGLAIASRTGNETLAGLGTIKADVGGHVKPAFRRPTSVVPSPQ